MPFNASGLFQRLFSWRNDRDAGVNILAERMDQEMDGIVAGINDMVSGNARWQGPMPGVFGTNALPAYTFQDDADTGMYRVSADTLGFTVGGNKIAELSTTGAVVSGGVTATNLTVSGAVTINWGNANSGAGSGLDADLLDGQQGAYYQDASNLTAGTVAASRLPAATTSQSGISQLNDSVGSTSVTQAATANAVKQANDNANTKAPAVHGHAIGDIAALQATLDNKAPVAHDHDTQYVKTTDVVNTLTSTATDKPLSAAQGNALNQALNQAVNGNRITVATVKAVTGRGSRVSSTPYDSALSVSGNHIQLIRYFRRYNRAPQSE